MPRRRKGGRKGPVVPVYGSDDERAYEKEKVPDPGSSDYFFDEVDKFHADREKILLDQDMGEDNTMDTDEEEVLGLDDSDSDTEEIKLYKSQLQKFKRKKKKEDMGSDIEEEGEEKGLPDTKAWGGRRNKYYGADVDDDDIDLSGSDDEETAALLEEKEALALQKKMAEQLDDQDFGLDIFKPSKKSDAPGKEDEKIVKDLSKLSKKEKLQLLKKESPELLTLIDDFKDKLTEVRDRLAPLRTLIQDKGVTGKAAEYVHTKFRLNLNYCINIAFYLMLKAKQVPVHNHPVIRRLLQYRNLMKQLEPVDQQLEGEITDILTRLSAGEDVTFTDPADTGRTDKFVRRQKMSSKKAVDSRKLSELLPDSDNESDDMYDDLPPGGAGGARKRKKLKEDKTEGRYETKDERAALNYYDMMKEGRTQGQEEEEGDISGDNVADDPEQAGGDVEGDEADPEGKRAISYQIQKNKGLTPQKKKENRNPRVKHRMKYRKAKIRRKGQVREARTEVHKYGGEISGIRAGIKRGIKLK